MNNHKSFNLSTGELSGLFSRLAETFNVCGPKRFKGRGRFSGEDLIKYAVLSSFEELELNEKSRMSPKSLVFPADETMFFFNGQAFQEPDLENEKETIVFLRPCDINGIHRLDKIFLENGDFADPYYKRRRERLHFFMIECRETFENCFCVSMGTNIASDYVAAVRFKTDGAAFQVCRGPFLEIFEGSYQAEKFEPEFVEANEKTVNLPACNEMPEEMFSDEMWQEYDSRCIACGRCNTSCVTCSCFSTRDLFYNDSRTCGERRRVWDGCHLDGFTDMAGGHSFRKNKGERMRFKTFHKIYDYRRRFGVDMCVGCGRCDDVCPEYISFSGCINKLSRRLGEGRKND